MTREDFEKMVRDDFKDHIAIASEAETHLGKITVLEWRNPKRGAYRIVYVMIGGKLMVYGDCGEGVYEWHQVITPKWLAGLDLDYFASKVKAWDTQHPRGKDWDDERAETWFRELLELEDGNTQERIEAIIQQARAAYAFDHPAAFVDLLHEHKLESESVRGGYVVCSTVHRHWMGLKLAWRWMQQAEACSKNCPPETATLVLKTGDLPNPV